MKLTDLNPKWIQPAQWSKQASPFYVGVSFDCPHCKPQACPTCGHCPEVKRLAVNFWPPIDPEKTVEKFGLTCFQDKGEHRRTGDTFETLTLSPSVGFESIGHWHGQLTDGEVTTLCA